MSASTKLQTSSIISIYDNLLLANQNSNSNPEEAHKTITQSLDSIRSYLIGASMGGPHSDAGIMFIKHQNQVELNASLVLLRWLSQTSAHPLFLSPATTSNTPMVHSQLINQLTKTFVILQGLLHLHPPSQRLFSSQFNLKILLNFLPLALHSSPFSPIALPLLDLLLVTFLDSPLNAQLFESAGGLEILVQAMKQKGLKTELRVKVLETLWAWWIDEEEVASAETPLIPPSMTPNFLSPNNYNSPFTSDLPAHLSGRPIQQSLSSLDNPESSRTPQKRLRPKSSQDQIHNHQTADTPSKDTPRGNSRIRPISLPPPSLSDPIPSTSLANLSDGDESLLGKSPYRKPSTPSVGFKKPIMKAKLTITQTNPTPSPSPVMMVKSSSEGADLNGTPSRVGTSWDPASRLRMMLENTAGEFIPATPHHPRRVRPVSANEHSRSPTRQPHVLHKSHPTPQSKRLVGSQSQQQAISEEPSAKPSDESEDSDQLDISPHILFGVRQRRTAIKQGNNTPQRLIRHKQSASLGSIQHQSRSDQTPKARTQSHQSSGEEARSGSGSEPEGQVGRSRDRAVRPLGSSNPFSPRSTTSSDQDRSATPDHSSRCSSSLSGSTSLLPPGTTSAGESSARKKIARVEEPPTARSNRISKTLTSVQGSSSSSHPSSSAIQSTSTKQRGGLKVSGSEIDSRTPTRRSKETSTILMPSITPAIDPITPVAAHRNPSSRNHNLDHKNLSTPAGLTPKAHLSSVAAHKRFIINRPLTPNKSLINHADLESIVNATDSDGGTSIILSPKKDGSSASAISQQKKKSSRPATKIASNGYPREQVADRDEEDQAAVGGRGVSNGEQKKKKPKIHSGITNLDHEREHHTKTGILEKYMANSDELVRSFKQIGAGFNLINHPPS